MHYVLELIDIYLGGGRVVHLEVVSYDPDPCSRLLLVGDLALGAIQWNIGECFGSIEEVFILLVGSSNELSKGSTGIDER